MTDFITEYWALILVGVVLIGVVLDQIRARRPKSHGSYIGVYGDGDGWGSWGDDSGGCGGDGGGGD